MVARIVTGKSIRGMLIYNEQKVAAGDALMLMASGFATDAERLSLFQKIERFNKLTKLNSRSKTNAMHISLNFHKDDKLNPQLLQQIAMEYMQRIGFADQPFIAYKHFDTHHPHLHIATTLINKNGERIKTEAIGKNLSEPARLYLEGKYELVQAKGRKIAIEPCLRIAEYGSKPTKRQIANITRSVKSDSDEWLVYSASCINSQRCKMTFQEVFIVVYDGRLIKVNRCCLLICLCKEFFKFLYFFPGHAANLSK